MQDTPIDDIALYDEYCARNEEYFPTSPAAAELLIIPAYLRAMGEPSLALMPAAGETYRFLKLPSFSPTTCIRIDDVCITARAWLGAADEGKGKLVLNDRRPLKPADKEEFRALLDSEDFWRMTPKGEAQGLDGAFWVLEGRRADAHHVVVRWSPDSRGTETGFVRLCEHLMRVAPPLVLPEPTDAEKEDMMRRRLAEEREQDERKRIRAESVARSNEITARLHRLLRTGVQLLCPHCQQLTRGMRFVDKQPHIESYFVCDRCKRSSTGPEIDGGEISV